MNQEPFSPEYFETLLDEKVRNHEILFERGQDPAITRLSDGSYVYIASELEKYAYLEIAHAKTIDELKTAPLKKVSFEMPEHANKNHWAAEIHEIDGELYGYYTADDGDNANHRMHVIRALDPRDPYGEWVYEGEIKTEHNKWAIDGTVMQTEHGNYFIWSGWEDDPKEQYLYISRMTSPTTVEDKRYRIASPDLPWEQNIPEGFKINEGPAILTHRGRTWCVYSANSSWKDDYCMGIMELVGDDPDPLDPESWVKKDTPFFAKTEGLYGPGHCTFTTDDQENVWMIYHSAVRSGSGWEREVRRTKILFDENGEPYVPEYELAA